MKKIFDIDNIGEYTKWTQLFKYSELEYISNYGFIFLEDDECVDGWCGFTREDGHINIYFNLKTGGVSFEIGAEELSITDTNIIHGVQQIIIDKQIKRHELGIE